LETFIDSVDVLDKNNVITSTDLPDSQNHVDAVVEEIQTSDLHFLPPDEEQVIIDTDGGETRVINAQPTEKTVYEGFEKPQMGFPAGYFKIHSRLNGKCLDVNGGSGNQGTKAILFDCHDGLHQQW